LLQISNDAVRAVPFRKNPIIRNAKLFNEAFVDRDFFIRVKNRKLTIVIEGEEIYIEPITIPKVRNFRIYDLVKNELVYKFDNIDNIIFNYKVIGESDKCINVIVYCANIENYHMLKKESYKGGTFTKINLLQNYLLNYLSKMINEKDYYIAFKYNRDIYFLLVSKNNLIANRVMKFDKALSTYTEDFKDFLEEYKEEYSYINKIYTLEISLSNIELDNFIVTKLKAVNNREFLNYIILKG